MGGNEKLTRLVKKAQEDISKFDELYEHVINKVYFWCFNAVGNRETAKDLTQESMFRIAKSLESLKEPDKFIVWAYVIAKNICTTYHRDNRNFEQAMSSEDSQFDSVLLNVEDTSTRHQPEKKFDEKLRNELVIDFVDNLPDKQREVTILYYLEELSVSEISEILDCKEATVKSNLFSARKNLEKQITDYQTTKGVRLYDKSIFLILGAILANYRDIICTNVDLVFDSAAFEAGMSGSEVASQVGANSARLTKLTSWLSTNLTTVLITTAVASTVLVTSVVANTNKQKVNNDNVQVVQIANDSIIKRINLLDVQDNSVPVTIELKDTVNKNDITIRLQDEPVSFDYTKQTINLNATKNGQYKIQIKDDLASFEVSSLDTQFPEVVDYKKKDGYIQFEVLEAPTTIDYEKSYVIANGKEYQLQSDNSVNGNITGEVSLYIYSTSNQFASYHFNIE